MQSEELEPLLKSLSDAAADAVDDYGRSSGEIFTDQMPEYVMTAAVARHLVNCGRLVILEASGHTICERLGPISDEQKNSIEAIKTQVGNGRIDLVLLSPQDDGPLQRPWGFVEFKKWKHDQRDVLRLTHLLSHIAGAAFGACIILKDTPFNDPWIQKISDKLGPNGIVLGRDIQSLTRASHQCCIVCVAQLQTSKNGGV